MATIGSWYDTINNTIVSGTSDFDSIVINGDNVTIYGNSGHDFIAHQVGTTSFIDGGDGNDKIFDAYNGYSRDGSYSHSTINGGNGNDTLYVGSRYSTVYGGGGDDLIDTWHGEEVHHIYIDAGTGNDKIWNFSKYATIFGGDGDDTFYNSEMSNVPNGNGMNSMLDGGAGDDHIINRDSNTIYSTLIGGSGQDTIRNSASYVTIEGGKDNDTISLASGHAGNVLTYANGDGKDTVYGYNSDDTLRIVGSSYSTQNSGTKDILVNVGTGSMLLVDAGDVKLNIIGTLDKGDTSIFTPGNDKYSNTVNNVLLDALAGNDYVTNTAENVTMLGNAGNDTLRSVAYNATIDGGAGDDYIYSSFNNVSTCKEEDKVVINGGAGNDTIKGNFWQYTVNGGDGNDYIHCSGSNGDNPIVIDGGNGNDTISGGFWKPSINGGSGSDMISLSGGSGNNNFTTVNAGLGNDTLYSKGNDKNIKILYQYANGDGSDVYYGYDENDTIHITSGTYSTQASGSDVIIKVGSGSILLKDAKGTTLNIITPEPGVEPTYVKLTNKDKSPYNTASGVGTVSGAEERTKAVKIVGNNESNVLIGGTKSDTLVGGGGVDTFVSGAGKDYVTDYVEGEVVSLAGSLTKAAASGNNVTLTSSKGTMILTSAKGKKVTFVDAKGNTTKQTFGVSAINVVDGDGATINTTYDTAVSTLNGSTRTEGITLIGNKKDNTIIGGSGDDVLTSGAGKDLFIYTGGNDVITDYAPGKDTIKLEGASITSLSYTGSQSTDLVLTTDKGTLTIENAMSMKSSGGKVVKTPQKLTIIQSDGTTTSQTYQLSAAASGVNTFSGGTGADTIYGFSSNDLLTGGKGKDVFIYGAGNDTITDYTAKQDEIKLNIGSASNYSVNGKDVIFTIDAANSLTVKDGAGKAIKVNGVEKVYKDYVNVVLTNQDANTYTATDSKTMTIDASKRTKDISIIGNANDNTITGGKKNDNLTGGAGADTFVYNNGYGNDVITDYSANAGDIIQLGKNTAVTGVTYSGNDLILTVGKGKITVKGGASQSVTVVDTNDAEMIYRKRTLNGYEERAYAEPWFAEDNNILTEDSILEVDSLSDSKAIGKVSIGYDTDALSIDKQSTALITYSQNKKTFD